MAAYTLFALLLALAVVVAAAWAPLDDRRGRPDRTGRAVASVMRRLEAAGDRGRTLAGAAADRARERRLPHPSGERLRVAVVAGLDTVARGATSLSGRLAAQRAAVLPASAPAVPARRAARPARGEDRADRAAWGRRPERRRGPGAPGEGTGEAVLTVPAQDGRDRLPAALRDRLAG